jgi:hypothetical protein
MSTCAGITQAGRRCTLSADPSSGMCWLHDPSRADQRHRHASKAARSKGNREVADLKEEIKTVIADVRAGDLDRNDAAVMIQGYRALKDFIALERQIKETDELEARMARIEALEQPQEGGRQWGA